MPANRRRSAQAASRRARSRGAWLFAPLLALGGCHYASSPLVGFGGFIGDTHSFHRLPNRPPGSDENVLRAQGRDVALMPLLPEGGNIWPGPPPPEPSLSDVQKLQDNGQPLPPPTVPNGSSTPPSLYAPQPTPEAPPVPRATPVPQSRPLQLPPPATTPTPNGPLINNGPIGAPGGISTGTSPGGGQSIIVPNGNGTSTVIAPDGSTQTVPTPR